MNAVHKYDIIDAQESAWKVDPFELNGMFTGVQLLSHHQRNLDDYMMELVSRFAVWNGESYELYLSDLIQSSQLELARLYIESIDREIEWACYGDDQTINSDFLCAMLSMLKDNNRETRDNFAKATAKNILIYYKDTLQKLLDDACNQYLNAMEESHYYRSHDMYEEE